MKSRLPSRGAQLAAALSFCLAASHQSLAAARYWDGATPGGNAGGGSGTWDQATSGNWSTAPTGGSATAYSTGTTAQQAVFAGTPGTVTVSGTVYVSGASAAAGSAALHTTGAYDFTGSGTIQLGGNAFTHSSTPWPRLAAVSPSTRTGSNSPFPMVAMWTR